MYKINKVVSDKHNFFQITRGIAKFPKSLYFIGTLPEDHVPTVSIIGTRKPTRYGEEVGYRLAYDLAKQGVAIVSGLALGMDAIAHRAALDAGGITIAVLPGGLDSIYPKTNATLARRIVASGGALITEYPAATDIHAGNFIARNRIVAAVADGVLVVEAAVKSGTVHTAGFALDYGRPVMAVPGNITSPMSSGTNNLITTGARLITSVADVLDEIGVRTPRRQAVLPMGDNAQETVILQLIGRGVQDGEELQKQSELSAAVFSQTLTMLEITQKIRPLGGNNWGL